MTNFIKNNINGILGTLIFHLLIILVFLTTKITDTSHFDFSSILIDFQSDATPEPENKQATLTNPELEFEQYLADVLTRNIAVSENEDRPVPDKFKDMDPSLRHELDQRMSEILQKAATGQMPELTEGPTISMDFKKPEATKEIKEPEPYTGPTNIYYNLQSRRALWLPVPIYKCPGSGIVTVDIIVNQLGNVIHARVISNPLNFNEECLQSAAIGAALKARFNQSSTAPLRQLGTITFNFQPQ